MTKPALYTLHAIAIAWKRTYARVWQLYAEIPSRLPEPDGFVDSRRPFWWELPKKPEDRRRK